MRQVVMTGLVAIAILSAALGFGISTQDVNRMRAFARRWHHDPDFRAVEREYVALGVDAMQARWWGVSGERVVMGFRSLPGLPVYLKAAGGSRAHYRAFSEGDIPAYLHLTSEQGVEEGLRMMEALARREPLADREVVALLNGFKLPVPIVTDAGAVASVRRLLADTQTPARAFAVRGDDIVVAVRRHVSSSAASLSQLDDAIRGADAELWRTKQVADFLGGIWAQGYGQIYFDGIEWLMRIRIAARATFVVAIVGIVAIALHGFRPHPKRQAEAAAT